MQIGDKVVCVPWNAPIPNGTYAFGDSHFKYEGELVVVGKVYVIRGIFDRPTHTNLSLQLVGSKVTYLSNGMETGWFHGQFRLLDEVQAENREKAQRNREEKQ